MTNKNLSENETANKLCKRNGCAGKVKERDLCSRHFYPLKKKGIIRICSVDGCEQLLREHGMCRKHSHRFKKHSDVNHTSARNFGVGNTYEERFWSKTIRNEETGCLEWQASTQKGYGSLTYTVEGKRIKLATHLAWYFTHKKLATLFLLHSCDNPKCVNPEHLREGTLQENIQDKVDRNRQPLGEDTPLAKLKNAEAREIKILIAQGVRDAVIAERFGVVSATISAIRKGKTWRHIQIKEMPDFTGK